ncbi:hypothetical protein AVEN_199588-1 [Araneus ventricosus]|uniref:Uncharacterized protein n=1 Tax=Araneus ventricosus TaxID=182803 RepID=A0A4Y2J2V7_ARAVE|nr:hypothetical protein AVEN_199588-1 [Araneus ventricosus]
MARVQSTHNQRGLKLQSNSQPQRAKIIRHGSLWNCSRGFLSDETAPSQNVNRTGTASGVLPLPHRWKQAVYSCLLLYSKIIYSSCQSTIIVLTIDSHNYISNPHKSTFSFYGGSSGAA